jgi:nucleoside-diphosphate-sugar epimerase
MGATGTVGSEVVRRLLAAGERPRAFVRDRDRARRQLAGRVAHVVGDLELPETIDAALAGVERVFLLTSQSRRQPDWERGVIQAAALAAVAHLVKSVFRGSPRFGSRVSTTRPERSSAPASPPPSFVPFSSCRTCSPWCVIRGRRHRRVRAVTGSPPRTLQRFLRDTGCF